VPPDGVAAVSALLATHGLASSVIGAIVPAIDGAERVQIG
jgi:phosphoribosylformylglycinamidine cyclo-ligase